MAAANGHNSIVALLLATPGVNPLAKTHVSGAQRAAQAQGSCTCALPSHRCRGGRLPWALRLATISRQRCSRPTRAWRHRSAPGVLEPQFPRGLCGASCGNPCPHVHLLPGIAGAQLIEGVARGPFPLLPLHPREVPLAVPGPVPGALTVVLTGSLPVNLKLACNCSSSEVVKYTTSQACSYCQPECGSHCHYLKLRLHWQAQLEVNLNLTLEIRLGV